MVISIENEYSATTAIHPHIHTGVSHVITNLYRYISSQDQKSTL